MRTTAGAGPHRQHCAIAGAEVVAVQREGQLAEAVEVSSARRGSGSHWWGAVGNGDSCGAVMLMPGERLGEAGTVVLSGPDHPLFLFNCDPEDVWHRDLRTSGAMKSFLHAYQQLGVPRTILVLSELPLDETRHSTVAHMYALSPLPRTSPADPWFSMEKALSRLRPFAQGSLDFQVVSQVYEDGRVDADAPLTGETLGDNTKPFPWPDDTFDLVLGRGVVCLCEINKAGGPCGVPCNLVPFMTEVARVLRRSGPGRPPHQALLHGDKAGGTERCLALWREAARALPPHILVTPLIYENRLRGIRIVKV